MSWGEESDCKLLSKSHHDNKARLTATSTFGRHIDEQHMQAVQATSLHSKSSVCLLNTDADMVKQIPALLEPSSTIAVIVVPLAAMAMQHRDTAKMRGIHAVCLGAGHSSEEQLTSEKAIRTAGVSLIYTTPEHLVRYGHLLKNNIVASNRKVSHITIDEAHLVVQWGTFRKAFQELGETLATLFPTTPIQVISTGMTPATVELVTTQCRLDTPLLVRQSPNLPHVAQHVTIKTGSAAGDILSSCWGGSISEPTMVICPTKSAAISITRQLVEAGVEAVMIHSETEEQERRQSMTAFSTNTSLLLVTTSNYSLNVIKYDIRKVVHYGLPSSLEDYYRQASNAGRDGQDASSHLFHSHADYLSLLQKTQSPNARKSLVMMKRYVTSKDCRRVRLVSELGGGDSHCTADECCDICTSEMCVTDSPGTGHHQDMSKEARQLIQACLVVGQKRGLIAAVKLVRGLSDRRQTPEQQACEVHGAGKGLPNEFWTALGEKLKDTGHLIEVHQQVTIRGGATTTYPAISVLPLGEALLCQPSLQLNLSVS